MNIRPMEMQVLIPKSTEVSRINQNETQRGTIQQQEFAEQLKRNMELRQKQAQQNSETEGRTVDKDKDANEKRKRSGKDKEENEEEKNEEEKKASVINLDPLSRGSILDINT